ncbi:hypothetical protein DDD_3331 [Nonlabens dokdonensis DSW-6]|uniref:Uncharacterized protein n=1 Tax=Nonlabens dokdonensis (strain DSM 17205 / KCTC 12402 / DSW-6) TaxID=592029 RepID=L7WHJ4_NONDD|nr:hypothetical protein DDD_3331 [Nonlabens dokdonensis DSW-6]
MILVFLYLLFILKLKVVLISLSRKHNSSVPYFYNSVILNLI